MPVTFRPDIEGLRGIAVLMVVAAHAGLPGFGGGFIGVDMFFVISGFLITGLLLRELETTGSIGYWAFFARRARRIAPALLAMLVLMGIACALLLPAFLANGQFTAGLWAALWSSNMYFALGEFDYFGSAAKDNVFLHTWSLGVEEQFYLVWPVLLAMLWRHARKPSAGLWAIAAGSLVACLWLVRSEAGFAYYSMPTRLWQLALGGLAFQWVASAGALGRAAGPMSWAGLVAMLASVVIIDGSQDYPSFNSILPVAAVAILMVTGSDGTTAAARLLAWRPLRFIGRISYSWYLWHWPFLVLGGLVLQRQLQAIETAGLVLASFLVAWLSYVLVEQPIRHSRRFSARTVVLGSVLACALTAAAFQQGAPRLMSSGADDPAGRASLHGLLLSMVSSPGIYDDRRCDQWYHSAELVPCEVVPAAPGGGEIIVIGDSIGLQWLPAIEHVARSRGLGLVVLTKSACAMVDEPFVYERIRRRYTECEEWRNTAGGFIRSRRPEFVLVGSSGSYPFDARTWTEGSARTLASIGAGEWPVVIMAPTPVLPFHGLACVLTRGRLQDGEVRVEGCSATIGETQATEATAYLREAAGRFPDVYLLDMNDSVCPEGRCAAFRDGMLVFRDIQHLNATFVETLGPEYDQRLRAVMAAPRR